RGTSLSRCPTGKCRRMARATFRVQAGLGSCGGLAENHFADRRRIESALADDDETAALLLAGAPGAIIIALDPAADGLHNLPQRLARNGEEALDAKNIETARSFAQTRLDLGRVGDRRHADNKALEVVVSVFLAVIVMGWTV